MVCLSHHGLKETDLDKECSQSIRNDIATKIINWKMIGHHLGIPDEKLVAIQRDNDTDEERRVDLLNTWHQREGCRATYRQLMNAFLQQGRRNLANSLCAMIKDSHSMAKMTHSGDNNQPEMRLSLNSFKMQVQALTSEAQDLKDDYKQQRSKLEKSVTDLETKRTYIERKQEELEEQRQHCYDLLQHHSIDVCLDQVEKTEKNITSIEKEVGESELEQIELIKQIGETVHELEDTKQYMEKCLELFEDNQKELVEWEKSAGSTHSGTKRTVLASAAAAVGAVGAGVGVAATLGLAAAAAGTVMGVTALYRRYAGPGEDQRQADGDDAASSQDKEKEDYEELIKTCSEEMEEMKRLVVECGERVEQMKEIVHDTPTS